MSEKGDLEKIKKIFSYVDQENISMEEMGVQKNVYKRKNPTLVDFISKRNLTRKTPLIMAAFYGHHQICEYLLTKRKANLEARDDNLSTALIAAASSNKIEVIKILLHHNANVMATDKFGRHAAYWAAMHGNLDALKMLLENEGDVINLKDDYRQTPLIVASRCGHVEICKYLVEEKNAHVYAALQYKTDPEIRKVLRSKCAE